MPGSNTVFNLQALRAIAAFMVVIFHARDLLPFAEAFPFAVGNAGVNIFFFISGFIIAHASMAGDIGNPGRFIVKRAIRIVPMYWLMTIATVLVAQTSPSLINAGGAPSIGMAFKSFFIPYFNPVGQILPVVYMGWTLNYEMFFYFLCSIALLIRTELHRLLTISAAIVSLTISGQIFVSDSAVGQTYTDLLMLEFVAGMWLSVAYKALPEATIGKGARVILIGIAFIAFLLLILAEYRWPETQREIKPGITGLWQISGRNDVSYRRRVAMDVAFARSLTPALYFKILILTVPAVLLARGSA